MKIIKNIAPFLIIIALSFWVIKPLFVSGFFPMHDDTQVARVFGMGKSLKDGMFPVRWVADLGYGYGYPIFNFYAPLAYYVGGIFNLLGFDALTATKIMMGIGIILSGIFMFLLAREFWGDIGGITSALFYLYAPYHAVDIYVRGDVSEFWAYAFIPLMFWGFYKVFRLSQETSDLEGNSKLQFKNKNLWKRILVASLGYAGVILSHNLTAMMITPFLLVFILLLSYIAYKNEKIFAICYLLFAILLGLAVSAFFWIPALLEMNYTNVLSQIGGGADFRNHFVCIQQLWNSTWGYGGSASGCIDGLSFKVGKLHVIFLSIAVVLALVFFIKRRLFIHYNDTYHYSHRIVALLFSTVGFAISIFLMLEITKSIWEVIPFMEFFQYPWRFLTLASFFSSFVAGSTIWFSQKLLSRYVYSKTTVYINATVIVLLTFYFYIKLFQPQTVVYRDASEYTSQYELKWRISKVSDEYMPSDFKKPKDQKEIPNTILEIIEGSGTVKYVQNETGYIDTRVELQNKSFIKANIAYFPSWQVFVNGKRTTDIITNKLFNVTDGIYLWIPQGNSRIEFRFVQTPIEKISNTISVVSVFMVVFLAIINSKYKNYER